MENRLKNLLDLRYDLAIDLYRQAAQARKARAKGLESLVYKVVGTDVMGSIALALDPYWQFNDRLVSIARQKGGPLASVSPVQVIPVNRKTVFPTILGGHSTEHYVRRTTGRGGGGEFIGPPLFWRQYWSDSVPVVFDGDAGVFDAPTIFGYKLDTTFRSRNPGTAKSKKQAEKHSIPKASIDNLKDTALAFGTVLSGKQPDINNIPQPVNNQGEFELFVPGLTENSSPGTSFQSSYIHYAYPAAQGDGSLVNLVEEIEHKESSFRGPTVMVSKSSVEGMSAHFRAVCLDGMARNLPTLLAKALPSRRNFNLYYQIAELKDLPAMFRSTIESWVQLEALMTRAGFKLALSDPKFWTVGNRLKYAIHLRERNVVIDPDKSAAEAFLNFKFGWQSVYQALIGLLSKPADATKEVNRLIARNGLDTTLSSSRTESGLPAYTPELSVAKSIWEYDDPNLPQGISGYQEIVYRCVVNAGIRFPDIQIPFFRLKLFLEKIGFVPTPSDIYSLVPWTWLIDWFSGLGDYLRLQETINDGKTTINYGFMSAHVKAVWTATRNVKFDSFTSEGLPWEAVGQTTVYSKARTVQMNCKFILRRGIGSIADIGMYNGEHLTDAQRSILISLLSTFSPGSKPGKRWATARQ